MDISDLKEILRLLEAQDITEFELEQDGVKLRVCRSSAAIAPASGLGVATLVPAAAAPAAALASAPPAAEAIAPAAEPAENGTLVKSPIVGTFSRAADPNSPAFVSVGDRVKVGQVLCIIEAMKLMNEIEAELAGEVVKVHPENGQPVQYGDPLFTVRPA
ncbi:MAG TPA: acetyl-CoA carboxylase biotin carboxyl carrier protein [Vicinamibacteria bacterium]|nr:acetyl-CoA carboxylase biotin carboxyl carrier protein [Vicinamibacteria bacterium]